MARTENLSVDLCWYSKALTLTQTLSPLRIHSSSAQLAMASSADVSI